MPVLELDDIDLYYESRGDGEPLLLIHGLGSSTRDWEHQVEYFARRYQVIVFDARGHGRSGKPSGPYSMALFATDTARLLQALDVYPAHVVGLSMGGMIAFELALSHPELVKSLVIVNSGPEFVVNSFKLRLQVWQRFLILRLLGMRKIGQVLGQRLFPKAEQAPLRTVFVERWAANDPKAYRKAMRAIIGWSVADRIAEIDRPTLVLASDQDYTPLADKQVWVERMAKAELVVIDDARHALPMEKPDAFNAAVETFLTQHG
jgi:3-oxoadipate enol-lactonase